MKKPRDLKEILEMRRIIGKDLKKIGEKKLKKNSISKKVSLIE